MNRSKRFTRIFGIVLVLVFSALAVQADNHTTNTQITPSVAASLTVNDQVIVNGAVVIPEAVMTEPGFIVIHADNAGAPGPVIGYRAVAVGLNRNLIVSIDASQATPVLHAMLHEDTGETGVYEFGMVEGVDGPVIVDGTSVSPLFNVVALNAYDQIVDGSYIAASVTLAEPGWLVIHADSEGAPGPVLGFAQVEAGTSANVTVELSAEGKTDTLFAMLHEDTGEIGVYEFGTVEGADNPVRLGEQAAVTRVWTVPHMQVDPQIVIHGDAMEMMASPVVTAKSVLSDGPGWLVIHGVSEEGGPGEVLGFSPVEDGLNTNVAVDLNSDNLTSLSVFPMLHEDTGEIGVYEFGTVEGADTPVSVNDIPVVFPVDIAPSVQFDGIHAVSGAIVVNWALIDAPGWLVIHADADGTPGTVLGYAPLVQGLNSNVYVQIEGDVPSTVFAMLHYDTGEVGTYEFDTVEGADAPVTVSGNAVVGRIEVASGM